MNAVSLEDVAGRLEVDAAMLARTRPAGHA
jgi:hypothetical protein